MFRKKRKLDRYRFAYGTSPVPLKSQKRFRQSGLPRSPRPSSPIISRLKKIFLLTLLTALVIYFGYLLSFSDYFKIKDIIIANQDFSNESLSEEIKSGITKNLGNNIIFIDTTELENKIISFFPELQNITVEKDYPDTLTITFSEYPLVANIINESSNLRKNYIINSVGYAIKADLENPSLPYIRIKSGEPINPENVVIEKNKLDYILETIAYFEDKFGMKVTEVEYKKIPREIHLLTERDFYIWLDIERPKEEQLKKLKKALVKLDIYKENLEYIDLRIAGGNGDKIIYKRK